MMYAVSLLSSSTEISSCFQWRKSILFFSSHFPRFTCLAVPSLSPTELLLPSYPKPMNQSINQFVFFSPPSFPTFIITSKSAYNFPLPPFLPFSLSLPLSFPFSLSSTCCMYTPVSGCWKRLSELNHVKKNEVDFLMEWRGLKVSRKEMEGRIFENTGKEKIIIGRRRFFSSTCSSWFSPSSSHFLFSPFTIFFFLPKASQE